MCADKMKDKIVN